MRRLRESLAHLVRSAAGRSLLLRASDACTAAPVAAGTHLAAWPAAWPHRWLSSQSCPSACWLQQPYQPRQLHQCLPWLQRQQQQQWPVGTHCLLSLRQFSSSSSSQLADQPCGRDQLYASINKRVTDQGWYILAAAVAMVGMTYAAVPLYRMFCQATGYGGTVMEGRAVEDKIRRREQNPNAEVERAAAARDITVYFNSDVADGMPWRFVPTQRSVRLHPGQSTLAFYTAHNKSDKAITGVSTYNVAPQQAGQYFNKIQCFCFEEQKLRPGEQIDMPVFFYIDPEFATDPKMKSINTITLSYTFFKVSEEEYEEAGEEQGGAAAQQLVQAMAPLALPAAATQ